jgi:ribonuclease VapC
VTGIVVDSSAVVAISFREPGDEWLTRQIRAYSDCVISAPNALEVAMVLEGRLSDSAGIGGRVLTQLGIQVASFTPEMAERATYAWRRFGKGRHPAGLNFGDCFTYALAEQTGLRILCIGNDFAQTDLSVLRPPEN